MFRRRLDLCFALDLSPCFMDKKTGKEYALWLNILLIGIRKLSSFADITVWLFCGRKHFLLCDRFDPEEDDDPLITPGLLRSVPKKERCLRDVKESIYKTVICHEEKIQNEQPSVSCYAHYIWLTSGIVRRAAVRKLLQEARLRDDARSYHFLIDTETDGENPEAEEYEMLTGRCSYDSDDIRRCVGEIYDTASGICRRFIAMQENGRQLSADSFS